MHRLLKRQLRRHTDNDEIMTSQASLLNAISDAYEQMDQEREIIERSLDLVSTELNQQNEALRTEVAKQQQAQEKLDTSLATLNAMFDATGEAIIVFSPTGRVVKYNILAQSLFGFPKHDGTLLPFVSLKYIYKQLEDPGEFAKHFKTVKLDPNADIFGQTKLLNGKTFEFHSSPQILGEKAVGRVWCFRDVSALKESAALIRKQAYYDALTGLPNRILLDDRLKHAIQYGERFDNKVAVLFIDLDDFKKVNDNAGHHAGDILLKEVTTRIQSCIREVDTLARLGGDEFVLVLENIQDTDIVSTICERIIIALSQSFNIFDNDYFISSSIGVSVYPQDGQTQQELMRKADMAMYRAKSLGKSNFQFFDDSLEASSQFHLYLENQLRSAIEKAQFSLVFQPKVCLKTQKVTAFEALIRWFDEGGNFVSPADFIPLAEQTGLIEKVGSWVLEATCQQIKSWKDLGLPLLPVAINVSPVEFNCQGLVDRFRQALEKYGIPGEMLEIEITESVFFEDMNKMSEILQKLRELGITVAVDDFGTGFSSLQYLHQLPIDVLKIDRSFIIDLEGNSHNEAIADTILTLARNLKLTVVAEGVETQASIDFLSERGCELAQGYFFYKPMQASDVTALLINHRNN